MRFSNSSGGEAEGLLDVRLHKGIHGLDIAVELPPRDDPVHVIHTGNDALDVLDGIESICEGSLIVA